MFLCCRRLCVPEHVFKHELCFIRKSRENYMLTRMVSILKDATFQLKRLFKESFVNFQILSGIILKFKGRLEFFFLTAYLRKFYEEIKRNYVYCYNVDLYGVSFHWFATSRLHSANLHPATH